MLVLSAEEVSHHMDLFWYIFIALNKHSHIEAAQNQIEHLLESGWCLVLWVLLPEGEDVDDTEDRGHIRYCLPIELEFCNIPPLTKHEYHTVNESWGQRYRDDGECSIHHHTEDIDEVVLIPGTSHHGQSILDLLQNSHSWKEYD